MDDHKKTIEKYNKVLNGLGLLLPIIVIFYVFLKYCDNLSLTSFYKVLETVNGNGTILIPCMIIILSVLFHKISWSTLSLVLMFSATFVFFVEYTDMLHTRLMEVKPKSWQVIAYSIIYVFLSFFQIYLLKSEPKINWGTET